MKTARTRYRQRWFFILIAPWLIGFVLFQAGPLLAVFGIAFTRWRMPQPPQFVGLDNFRALLTDPLTLKVFWNTLYYCALTVPSGISFGLALALLLRKPGRATALLRAVYFLPVVITGVAMTLLWGWLFNAKFGPINQFLALLGVRGPAWLTDPTWAMPALLLMSLWGVGINMMVYLAALQSVPAELMDAARIDGASAWRRFRSITWHLITPTTFYLVIVNLIGSFQLFTPAYILTKGGPEHATLMLALHIYLKAFLHANMGQAAGLALLLLLVVMALTWLQFRLSARWVFYTGGR